MDAADILPFINNPEKFIGLAPLFSRDLVLLDF